MLKVAELMTRSPRTVTPETSLGEVLALMNREGTRHMPVVEDGALVGIVTERDIRLAVASPTLEGEGGFGRLDVLEGLAAGASMTPAPATAAPDDCAHRLADEMALTRFGAYPVVEDGTLVGIVSTVDYLRYVAGLAPRD